MKLKLMTTAILASLTLSGCSSSGGSDSTSSFTGTVADGYISEATVCLDRNNNLQCDPDEPSSTTDKNGRFSLNITATQANQYPIIASIPAGAIDTGRGITINKAYVMSALPEKGSFISPLTTLAAAEISTTPGLTAQLAAEKIAIELGTPDLDITKDYVAEASNNDTYKQAEKVAPIVADLIAKAANTDASTLSATKEEVIHAASKKIIAILPTIKLHIENDEGELEEQDIENIVSLVGDKITVTQLDLDELKKNLELAKNSSTLTVTDLLGKNWYEIDQDDPNQIIVYQLDGQDKRFKRLFCSISNIQCLTSPNFQTAESSPFILEGNTITLQNNNIELTGGSEIVLTNDLLEEFSEEIQDLLKEHEINIEKTAIRSTLNNLVGKGKIYTMAGVRKKIPIPEYESSSFDGSKLPWDDVDRDSIMKATSVNAFIDALPEENVAGNRPGSPIRLKGGEYWAWLDNGKQHWKICEVENNACKKDSVGNDIILSSPSDFEKGTWNSGQFYVQIIDPATIIEGTPSTYVLTNDGQTLYEAWFPNTDRPFLKTVFDQNLAAAIANLIPQPQPQ